MSDYKFKVRPQSNGLLLNRGQPILFKHFAAFYASVPNEIKLKQEFFQRQNGVPIHLKGGLADRLLFGLTVGLIGLGLLNHVVTYYGMMYPKKKK